MAKSLLPVLTSSRLLIDKDFLNRLLMEQICDSKDETPPSIPTVKSECRLINSLDNVDLNTEAIYYHPIFGLIIAEDLGYDFIFSTQRFVANLKAADECDNIVAHFLHISSGGGEAWFLDKAAEAIRDCKKPVYAFVEKVAASAAYYLACNANIIKAYTNNDTIGSIGTMCSYWDSNGYLESLGYKKIEQYATKSDLKNKIFTDLENGKPERYIKERLDPLQLQFEQTVRTAREPLNSLPDDHPVFRGEIFYANQAQDIGLIDGIVSIEEALSECYDLGVLTSTNNKLLKHF